MLPNFIVLFALVLHIFAEKSMQPSNPELSSDRIHSHAERGNRNKVMYISIDMNVGIKSDHQDVGAVIERMISSIRQRNEKEAATRDKLKQLTAELRPYFDQTKTKFEGEQELEDIDGALAEAQNQLAEESGIKEQDKEAEIARIRDEINKIRYGLKERLQNILLGRKKKPSVQAENKSEALNNITGTTSWQTATWILLALCIFLSIVLIGAITHMISRKRNYERIKSSTLM
ncbi:hypothetical protein OESDEN_14226 [Oesophagostomum dentatum]|uniref:Uncharacterized protein n=1 Tax=Oesophagostomum dentatum TaxID=61180 RepID=A0A0B1SQ65_OESDE|nr:hypothetical protein OESDEN_14226 [Oesophagostomum dentatum]